MRAAIYARFSTELQNDKSIDDQEALCRAYAAREGHEVVQVYSDAAKSGGSIQGRPGVQQLMRDAGQDRFQVIIVEALDRLSRDMEDLAGMYKRLKFGGIKILAVHEGQVNTVLVGLRGLVGQLMREDNVEKVRRGMTGLISRGLSAGGLAYGYRVNPEKKGEFLVVPEQAATVKEIFERYVAGQSPRKIAYDLNDRGVPPPRRGSKWNASTINGWADRGSGILHNQLYVGKYVWNKNQFVKPPDSDKRISRANPPSEWKSMELPELRIISDELFEAAQRERKTISEKNFAVRRRPQRLLSGLLKCGSCGSGMAVWGKDSTGRPRIRCSAYIESGSCPEPHSYYLSTVERAVFDHLEEKAGDPEALADYVAEFQAEKNRVASQSLDKRTRLERDIASAKREIARLVEMVQKGVMEAEDIADQVKVAKAARDEAQSALNELEPVENVLVIHPGAIKKFSDQIKALRDHAAEMVGEDATEAAKAIRALIDKIIVHPHPEKKGGVRLEIQGRLNHLLTPKALPKGPGGGLVVPMVAEEGFEPLA